jgi:hypothetical protein
LAGSIKGLGLLRPLWLAQDEGGNPWVIAGGRRLKVLADLGYETVPCLAPEPPEARGGLSSPPEAFLLSAAFADNFERGYNLAETVLGHALCQKLLGPDKLREVFAVFNLGLSAKIEARLKAAAALPPAALEAMAQGRLDLDDALALAQFTSKERTLLLDLFDRVRPSRQNRRLWLEWLTDLKRMTGKDLDEFLSLPALVELNGPQAEKRAKELIFSRRFPQVFSLRALRRELVNKLRLPPYIKLSLDPELEDEEIALKLTLNSPSELTGAAAELAKLSLREEWLGLWLLDEADK